MSLYDWLLFLHVVAAFALVAALVLLIALFAALRRATGSGERVALLRLSGPANRLWDVGGLGTLVLGAWLAIHVDGYELWDGWILGALVLWVIATVAGSLVATAYRRTRKAADGTGADETTAIATDRGLLLHTVMALAVTGMLALMIFKPGA